MSSSSSLISSEVEEKEHLTPPPGLELMFAHNFPKDCKNPFAALVLAVHWSTIHTTNLRLTDPSSPTLTESLPASWDSKIAIQGDSSSPLIRLEYKNLDTGKSVTVTVQELAENQLASVMSKEVNPEKEARPHAAMLETDQYVNCTAVTEGDRNVNTVYKIGEVWKLCETIKKDVLPEEVDARKPDNVKSNDPYKSALSEEQEALHELDRKRREEERRLIAEREEFLEDPLAVPSRHIPFPNPNRGIGRSDLDPFSGIGSAGGMLMDPRGFRRPQLPHGVPPGARFDPFGPPAPGGGFGGGNPFGPRPGGGRGPPGVPFGFINPDHEMPPHGFDDMFS